jgi:hypothetical protein
MRLGPAVTGLWLATLVATPTPHAATDPAATCAAAKRKAVGKCAFETLKCHAEAARRSAFVEPRCRERAEAKLAQAFARAEQRGGCTTSGDAGVLQVEVDVFVEGVVAALPAPPPQTTTSTTLPTDACGGASVPQCDGVCPAGEFCGLIVSYPSDPFPGFACGCLPGVRSCGEVAGAVACSGECPPGEACVDTGGVCACVATVSPPACGDAFTPQCNGSCPAGEMCAAASAFACACVPGTGPCGASAGASDCVGECAPGAACFTTPMGGACECRGAAAPPACADAEAAGGLCDGSCPAGQYCVLDGGCHCEAFPCGFAGPPLCLGECPPEAPICRDVGGTCQCEP